MSSAVITDELVNTTNQIKTNIDSAQLLTIRQFCDAFPWPSESAMRAYIFRANELGISDAFVRVGRRVLVMPQKFFLLLQQVEYRSKQGDEYETTSWKKGELKNYFN